MSIAKLFQAWKQWYLWQWLCPLVVYSTGIKYVGRKNVGVTKFLPVGLRWYWDWLICFCMEWFLVHVIVASGNSAGAYLCMCMCACFYACMCTMHCMCIIIMCVHVRACVHAYHCECNYYVYTCACILVCVCVCVCAFRVYHYNLRKHISAGFSEYSTMNRFLSLSVFIGLGK